MSAPGWVSVNEVESPKAPLKAMDDYHWLFSLRPSEQLFLNQLHLIWEEVGSQGASRH